jgi:hypothetical protein
MPGSMGGFASPLANNWMYCIEVFECLLAKSEQKLHPHWWGGGSRPLAMPTKLCGHGITEPCGESELDSTSGQLFEVSRNHRLTTLIPTGQKWYFCWGNHLSWIIPMYMITL